MRKLGLVGALAVVVAFGALRLPAPSRAALAPELPLAHREVAAGTGVRTVVGESPGPQRTIDGNIDDWVGTPTRFGGASAFSRGEWIYTDHVFDAHGANTDDPQRQALLDAAARAVRETYRLDPILQQDIAGELGLPGGEQIHTAEEYGDAGFQEEADLLEVRVAARDDVVDLLVRTTTMTAPDKTAVVVLADTVPGGERRTVPFGSGLTTNAAEIAVLLVDRTATVVDLRTGQPVATDATVMTNAGGYVNAVEARLPRSLLARGDGRLRLAVATGLAASPAMLADLTAVPANLANVAFRPAEPVRTWFDKQQALALADGAIDGFFAVVDAAASEQGVTERYTPTPGYHERVFLSAEVVSAEDGLDGVHQHYGVYLPPSWREGAVRPLTFWLHWRGGKAHSAATISPRIMRDHGDGQNGIVVSPRGRGTSKWYIGIGLHDIEEVWADVTGRFAMDRDRVYVTGHSMGGWGSYLLPILFPDRFAGALPVAGPVTQGAWTGIDFEGCDDFHFEQEPDYTPCYIATNDSNPRVQHTRRLLENLRNVPIGIFQGGIDELVPTSGVTRQVERLVELGYRHRYFLFPTYEHYSHPVVDEWMAGVEYLKSFKRDPNPPRVTYIRDMPFELSVEQGPNIKRPDTRFSFDFDRAYWMSGLMPIDPTSGVARFDGRSLAIRQPVTVTVPELGGPATLGQVGPYVMTGLAWRVNPLAARPSLSNGFEVTLSGAQAVTLDVARMALHTDRALRGQVTTDKPLALRLAGTWTVAPPTLLDGSPVMVEHSPTGLVLHVPPGTHHLVLG